MNESPEESQALLFRRQPHGSPRTRFEIPRRRNMIYRLTLAVTIAATMATMASAQNATGNALPANPQIQPQPQYQVPLPQTQNQVQPQPRTAPYQQPHPGQGTLQPQTYQNNYRPLIGSGLIGAQKDGCNCFQLPPVSDIPQYDPYASRNYWDLCPPACGSCPSSGCSPPRYDFNRFIPRPTQPIFRRF